MTITNDTPLEIISYYHHNKLSLREIYRKIAHRGYTTDEVATIIAKSLIYHDGEYVIVPSKINVK